MFDTCDPVLGRFLCLEWRHTGDAGMITCAVLCQHHRAIIAEAWITGNPTGRRGLGKGRAR